MSSSDFPTSISISGSNNDTKLIMASSQGSIHDSSGATDVHQHLSNGTLLKELQKQTARWEAFQCQTKYNTALDFMFQSAARTFHPLAFSVPPQYEHLADKHVQMLNEVFADNCTFQFYFQGQQEDLLAKIQTQEFASRGAAGWVDIALNGIPKTILENLGITGVDVLGGYNTPLSAGGFNIGTTNHLVGTPYIHSESHVFDSENKLTSAEIIISSKLVVDHLCFSPESFQLTPAGLHLLDASNLVATPTNFGDVSAVAHVTPYFMLSDAQKACLGGDAVISASNEYIKLNYFINNNGLQVLGDLSKNTYNELDASGRLLIGNNLPTTEKQIRYALKNDLMKVVKTVADTPGTVGPFMFSGAQVKILNVHGQGTYYLKVKLTNGKWEIHEWDLAIDTVSMDEQMDNFGRATTLSFPRLGYQNRLLA